MPAPFGSLLSRMSIKDGEKSLAMYTSKWHYDGVGVLHESSRSLRIGHGAFEGIFIAKRRFTVETNNDLSEGAL